MFLASSYALDPAALPFAVAGLLALGIGFGFLLYERFASGSRHFFALSTVMAGWLFAFAASYLAEERSVMEAWYRIGLGLMPLGMPVLYDMAQHLTDRRSARRVGVAWAAAVAVAATAAGPLTEGISHVLGGAALQGPGPVALVFAGYIAVVTSLVVHMFWRGYREAQTTVEGRRHQLMAAGLAVGAVALVDFFVPAGLTLPSGVAPLAVTASLLVMAIAGTRYRAFSFSLGFATDEILRAMGDAVLVCDQSGAVRVANAEALRVLGASKKEVVGSHVARWLHDGEGGEAPIPPGRPLSSIALARDREMFLRPLSGAPIQVSVSIEPIMGGGSRRGLVVVARDIRDRAESHRALQKAERRYRALFWHNPGAAYEFDLEGRFQAVNPATEQLLGLAAAKLNGLPFSEVIAPADRERATGIFEAVVDGQSSEYELAVVTASGKERELRGVSVPIVEDGRVVGVFGVALDVTEQTRVKRELEVQRRYFADLFEASPEGIVLVDAERDEVLRVNSEFTRMFGYTAGEAVGRKLNDLIVPDHLKWEGSQLHLAAREGARLRTETVRCRKDGTSVDVSVLARSLPIPGEREQLYGVYRDIGDRIEAERALREREEELRHAQKLEAVGKLAGGIAHDFNNLLTVINGHARFALEEIGAGHPLQEDLLEIEKAGSRAATLTQQLLAYSRRQVLHPQMLDPNAVVLEVHGMLRRLIGEHIRVETRLTQEDILVRADRGQLEQVLMNLLVNARDAMPDGGTITMETDAITLEPGDPRIGRWEVDAGRFVRIRVSDTGTGMDATTLEHAFEPFFTTKEQGRGTGLGLATVFGIVKQSGGHVLAESEPGGGTRCDVILPHVRKVSASAAGAASEVDGDQPYGTILVVEDEPAVRKLAVRVLERAGCTVLSAGNGKHALRVIEEHHGELDLVVTDMVMPDMGGRELAVQLRRRHPGLPVLYMSGYDEELLADSFADSAFLAKPFTPAALTARVAEALRRAPTS